MALHLIPAASAADDASAAVTALRDALPRISAKSREFAESLVRQSYSRGLSEKQMFWVRKLVADLAPKSTEPKFPPPAAAAQVGDMAGVVALFATARQHLKFPKIRLQLDDARPIVLSVAGANAKRPGTINVTDGGAFGSNTWYGRVTTDGGFEASRSCDAATLAAISALLRAFAADPARVAAAYGKLVGSCCFCSRTLTDERSTDVGYGPICADHYGLPWGGSALRCD